MCQYTAELNYASQYLEILLENIYVKQISYYPMGDGCQYMASITVIYSTDASGNSSDVTVTDHIWILTSLELPLSFLLPLHWDTLQTCRCYMLGVLMMYTLDIRS